MIAKELHGLSILDAIASPHLLGASIRNQESFRPWLALLASMKDAADLYRRCTGRSELPEAALQFAWFVVGRRGGETFTMALIAVFKALFHDWLPFLSPGERAVIQVVAADREQAKIVSRYVSGILHAAPLLAQFIEAENAFSIELVGNVAIEIATRSFRTVRGRSVGVALLDELAFWRDEESANPDADVVNAIRASMATFGDQALLIGSSTPYGQSGVLWDAYERYHSKPDARNIVWQADTRTMNPTVPQSFIDAEFERDPVSASAEYGAQFRSDFDRLVSADVVKACIATGTYELAPQSGVYYTAFADPSGGSADSFTLAISHREKIGTIVLDAVREVKPPFSPDAVCGQFSELLKRYKLRSITMDRYGGDWPAERFRSWGVSVTPSEKPKSDIYLEMLPLLNARRVELLDNKRLVTQLCSLERHTSPSGKDRIDHPKGLHDDLINAAAGAIVAADAYRMISITQEHINAIRPSVHGKPTSRSYGMRPNPFVGSVSDLFN